MCLSLFAMFVIPLCILLNKAINNSRVLLGFCFSQQVSFMNDNFLRTLNQCLEASHSRLLHSERTQLTSYLEESSQLVFRIGR